MEGSPVRVGSVRAVFNNLTLPVGLVIRTFTVEGSEVLFETNPMRLRIADPANAEAVVEEQAVQDLVRTRAGDQLRDLAVRLLPGRIEATATVQMLFPIRATAVLTLRIVEESKVYVDVASVNVLGAAGQNLVQKQLDGLNPILDASSLPFAVRFHTVDIREGELVLTGAVSP